MPTTHIPFLCTVSLASGEHYISLSKPKGFGKKVNTHPSTNSPRKGRLNYIQKNTPMRSMGPILVIN
ncbi:hypothetical protein YC2023_043029 [Brassica napus]